MSVVQAVREAIRAELAGKPDIAHQQLVGREVWHDHPAFDSIVAHTGKPPMKAIWKRITPFWERDA